MHTICFYCLFSSSWKEELKREEACGGSDCHYRRSLLSQNNTRFLAGGIWSAVDFASVVTVQGLQHLKSFKSLLASPANWEALQMLVGVASLYPASSQATRHTATSQSQVFLLSQHTPSHILLSETGLKILLSPPPLPVLCVWSCQRVIKLFLLRSASHGSFPTPPYIIWHQKHLK